MVEYAVDWEVGSDVGVGRVVSVKVLRDDRRVWSRWDVLPFVPLWVAGERVQLLVTARKYICIYICVCVCLLVDFCIAVCVHVVMVCML